MKRRSLIFILSILLITFCSRAISSYVILGNDISGNTSDIIVNGSEDSSYSKVVFQDENGNEINKVYIKNGDKLNYEDLPTNYNSAAYKWVDEYNNDVFSLNNNSFSDGVVINEDTILKAENIMNGATTTNPNSSNFVADPNDVGDSSVTTSNGKVVINEGNTTGSIITMSEPILNNVDFDLNFKTTDSDGNKGSQNIYQDLGDNGNTQHSSDTTIGLEDSNSDKSIYKPKAGSESNNRNPLVTRLVLDCDTFVTGQSWLGVGARTGFYGGGGWSQFNYQGFINGSYNEIDLNGNTLIIGSGATLELRGSIIDSSVAQTGKIIVEDGGTIKASFVIEDHYHETSIPVAYAYGDAPFKMYRMPYLNVPVRLNKGASLIGYLRLDFGGDGNDNYADSEINLIGGDNTYIINTSSCSEDSYILREPVWDSYWYPQSSSQQDSTNTETETVQSIVYQKFDYKFYNCDQLIVNSPTIPEFPYKVAATTISFQIYWERCDFFIPPYFNLYLYNSNATISNNFVFLPGSYLYVDENSSITLSVTTFKSNVKLYSISGDFLGAIENTLPKLIKIKSSYQGVGGLLFVDEKSYWLDSYNGWTDNNNEDSQPAIIYSKTSNFWSYMNKNYPAKADIYGEIKFDNTTNLVKENYHLGGEINIYNMSKFSQNVNEVNSRVELYNSTFIGSSCHFNTGILGGDAYFNIDSFVVMPLISSNNVLTDMNSLKLRADYKSNIYTFDHDSKIIKTSDGTMYGYTFVDNSGIYNNWNNYVNKGNYDGLNESNYRNAVDDLSARFYQISSSSNGIVSMNIPMYSGDNTASYSFIYFRGAFFRYNGGKVDIFKFKGPNPDSNNNGFSNDYSIAVTYGDVSNYYGHNMWVVS